MAENLKILFMGTPELGATVLKALANSSHQVIGVVTQPDRPAGRKNVLTPPPVKVAAQELGLPIMQVEKLRGEQILGELREFSQAADVFVVAAFGMLLPTTVLEMPRLKCLNVHGSLLPKYRGASPVAQALLDGCLETGVTIMQMEKGLDTGPMLSKVVVPIASDETQASLMQKLAEAGVKVLLETLPAWAENRITPEVQDDSQATLTGIIKKEYGRINWAEPAVLIERKIRAYDPWPGVFTSWNGQQLKILKAEVVLASALDTAEMLGNESKPGRVSLAKIGGVERLLIITGSGFLAPTLLQLAGKKVVNSKDFVQGQRAIINTVLGE